MKISHLATVAFLAASAICSIGALALVACQFTLQRSAVSVISLTFPSGDHSEQFCLSVREVAHLCGTRAHIRKVPADQAHLTLREAKQHDARIF